MSELLLRGEPIGKVKAILFDKDGTLSNSEEHLLLLASLRIKEASKLFKYQKKNPKNIILKLNNLLKSAYGLTSDGFLKPDSTLAVASREHNLITTATIFTLLGEGWPQALKLAYETFNKVDALYLDHKYRNKVSPLLPGCLSFLQKIEEEGLEYSLISNDDKKGIESFLKNHNLDKKVSNYWSCEDNPMKPDPDAVRKLCKSLHIEPQECALIGDADSDLCMAKEAGVRLSLGYTGGWQLKPLLSYQDHLIHHWDELSFRES